MLKGRAGKSSRPRRAGLSKMPVGDLNMSAETIPEMEDLVAKFRAGVEVRDRKFRTSTYKKCFVGSDAVTWMLQTGGARSEEDAIALGNAMMEQDVFHHVVRDHPFKNEDLFYRFAQDENHGQSAKDAKTGAKVTWERFLGDKFDVGNHSLQPKIPQPELSHIKSSQQREAAMSVLPLDEFNVDLLNKVHPADWVDPKDKGKYHMVVIGAGAGGLITAGGAAGIGAKVALIEGHLLGGDCLNVGCVPSKALIAAAKVAKTVTDTKKLEEFGVEVTGEVKIDFAKIMERLRRVRAGIAENDSAERYAEKLGVDVYMGYAKFTSPNTVEINGQTLTFSKAVVATGGSPQVPPIPGLQDMFQAYKADPVAEPAVLTNENVFNLTTLPKRIGVIGTGAIGLELAQSFQRLGARVLVFGRSGVVMPKEDQDLSDIVRQQISDDGVEMHLKSEYVRAEKDGKTIKFTIKEDGKEIFFTFDALIIAAGRAPNVSGLGLEKAGVQYDSKKGVEVDDSLRSSNPNIFAVGDVASTFKFTHVADFMARMVIRNALFFGKEKFSNLIVPWCTYTEPELAHVGLYHSDAIDKGIEIETFEKAFEDNDRAICEGETEGIVRIHVKKGTDTIVGASIVGPNAGDMISEITLAMNSGVGLGKIASVIHPYPTTADAIRACGDLYNRTRLTLPVKALFRQLLKFK